MEHYYLNRKYKDRLFRFIFNDKENLLQLYNAINDSHYSNPDDLVITTIDDVVYMGMKNDLSFMIDDIMNLYEHQSTYSPNLPLRGLFYFSAMYRNYIEPMKQKLYTDSPLRIPFPVYLVFYNGSMEEPERKEILLSDLFIQNGKGLQPALECTAPLLNINFGHNQELMEKCRILKEYALFIHTIRSKISVGLPFQEAVETAVEDCISKNILSEILRKNKAEVIDMILTEYDENEFREFLKEDSWKKGHEAGMQDGIKTGIREIIRTFSELQLPKEQLLEKLMNSFSLSVEEAEEYIEKYSKF
ncbi:MAG: hypothetical protein UGF43_08380 [Blautia sp.]|uniref:hypothetical protein n=1 Tax=Blautia sp. TaxID=1955243 RepID=UPI002E77A222|nr:hypothetical protein [Blautia sp.]MEE1443620.1 hypothetical protein [Blautia sp.]